MDSHTGPATHRAIVRFDVRADPVSGRVTTDGGDVEFPGWMELVEILERARAGPRDLREGGDAEA
jgi:hypothetical protein